jgi:hypothetical protein
MTGWRHSGVYPKHPKRIHGGGGLYWWREGQGPQNHYPALNPGMSIVTNSRMKRHPRTFASGDQRGTPYKLLWKLDLVWKGKLHGFSNALGLPRSRLNSATAAPKGSHCAEGAIQIVITTHYRDSIVQRDLKRNGSLVQLLVPYPVSVLKSPEIAADGASSDDFTRRCLAISQSDAILAGASNPPQRR